MFNTVVTIRGVTMFYYCKLTENQWRHPGNRYKVKLVYPGVYTINVPPSGRITQGRHAWLLRAMHARSPEKHLHIADSAGPHQGMKVLFLLRTYTMR